MASVLEDPLTEGWASELIAVTEYDMDSPVCLWQTFEHPSKISMPYVFHFIRTRVKDPNNLLAASWTFHQLLHGMHLDVPEEVPGLVVEYVGEDGSTVKASDGIRHKVDVLIRFLDETNDMEFKNNVRNRLKDGSKVNEDGSVESFVHVLDVESFRECVDVKGALTEAMWRRYKKGKLG